MQRMQLQEAGFLQPDRGEIDLNRMSKNGEFHVRVVVRSLKRAEAYKMELERLAVLVRQATYDIQIFFPMSLYQSIIEIAANHFDELIINYLDLDLIDFRKKHGIADKDTSITNVQAQTALKNYYKEVGWLDSHLSKVFPLFSEQLQLISDNYRKHIVLMLKRVATNESILNNDYFNPEGSPITLVHIRSTGSDWHKQGQNVLILQFKNMTNQYFKVIYKPSPVVTDVFLIGDLKKLAELLPGFKGKQSILEIFNENLPEHEKLLPTFIVPLYDQQSIDLSDIQRHFGFEEFVGNERWYSIDKDAIEKKLFQLQPSQREESPIPQNIVNKGFIKFVRSEAQQADCRFIASSEQEGVMYSYQCGLLVFIMLAFSVGDSHTQNLIIDRVFGKFYQFCTPRLIDSEICFTRQEPTITKLACFDTDLGSMHPSSTNSEPLHFLFDVFGKCKVIIDTYEKNRLLVCSEDYTKITPYEIDRKSFQKGLENGMCILQAQQNKIMAWLEDVDVRTMYVRVVTYATYIFKDEVEHSFKNKYKEFSNYAKRRLEGVEYSYLFEQISSYKKNCKKISEKAASFFCVCQPPSPMIYNYPEYLYREYFSFSIPVYYARASSLVLFDSNGHEVKLTAKYKELYPEYLEDDYFGTTPLQFTKNRVTLLINDVEIKTEFFRQLEIEVGKIAIQRKKLNNLVADIKIPEKIRLAITSNRGQGTSSAYKF